MFNPFDMTQGQTAAGMQGFGQQFGLTPDQTRRAMEALLPAFALGLQRNDAQDPAGLLKLFTSPLLSQAVIRQAASASGVGGQALRQMLPMMAGMVVASVVHMLLNQQIPQQAPPPEPEPQNPFLAGQTFWADMMKGFMPSPGEAAPVVPASPSRPPEPRPTQTRPAEPKPAEPKPAEPKPAEAAPADLKTDASGKTLDVFQQMLLTGAEVQEENVKAMRGIFDAFWTDGAPRSATAPQTSSTGSAARPAKSPRMAAAKTPATHAQSAPSKPAGSKPSKPN